MAVPQPDPVTVAVINDHELIVKGVASMLAPHRDLVEVVELDSLLPLSQPVDIALYDTFTRTNLDQPDLDDLARNDCVGRVVIYTWNLSYDVLDRARSAGVSAAISKDVGGAELARALVEANRGELDLAAIGAARSADVEPAPSAEPKLSADSWPGRDEGLTPREAEIIVLVTAGLSNDEIAQRACLSINSVKSYIRTAYRTMGVTTRSQAVLWGVDHGMRPRPTRVQPGRVTLPAS